MAHVTLESSLVDRNRSFVHATIAYLLLSSMTYYHPTRFSNLFRANSRPMESECVCPNQ